MNKKKMIVSGIFSFVIFVLVCFAWFWMFTRAEGETFAQRGFGSLKYFTVESNLLMAIAAFIHICCILEVIRGTKNEIPAWSEMLYYMGTTAVSLTFGMVMIYLGPAFGYGSMLEHSSLYFHLIVPVLAIISFCVFHRGHKFSLTESAAALLPLILYGGFYISMILRYGLDRPKADWYWLAIRGKKSIPFVFLLIVICTWGIALLLRFAVNGNSKDE